MNYKDWINSNFDKKNDLVLITGASSGIGYEYLRLLAAEGCRCIIVSNEKERLASVANEISHEFSVEISGVYCDLQAYEDVVALCEKVRLLNIKILINNAGFGLKGNFIDFNGNSYREILNVNALAPTLLSHAVLPNMLKANAGIHLNVATINVVSPIPFNTVYTATKSYVYFYSLALAHENKKSKIVFQVMLPGTTNTPFHEKQGSKPSAMTMQPNMVARRSLDNLHKRIYIPNKGDRLFFVISAIIPMGIKMSISAWVAKKRLGLRY